MLLRMLEEGMQIDEIVFCDTRLEFPAMYDHIDKVEKHIGREITRIASEHSFEYYMFDYVKKKGKNKGSRGYSWPLLFKYRWCTDRLKQMPIKQYFRQYQEVIEYHGIATDEIERTGRNVDRIIKYPLVDWGMTEEDCLKYCYNKGFDWDGLYEKFDRVSCFLCPHQPLKALKTLWREFPELWEYTKKIDRMNIERYGMSIKERYSIEDLEQRFIEEDRQLCFDFAMGS